MIGRKFGNYEILRHIGSGGMGEVYEATDSRLGRSVAVKVLPEEFTHDAERVARFQREARVLASLNHSAIASVHGFEDADGRSLLVMEFVPGQTLAERIESGSIPLEEALAIATQIADALEYAHDKGIVHRDLKPANVKITPDGKVKLLDFGLAKAFECDTAPANLSNSPTRSAGATNAGVILGTAAYMSPEQARGRAVDKRADIWAFAVVLYEMLTGKQLFKGEDLTETLAAVVKEQPPLDDVPPRLRPLLKRCLEKDPSRRLRDISGFKLLLEESPTAVITQKSSRAWIFWAVAAGLGVTLVAALWVSAGNNSVTPAPILFQVPAPSGVIRYATVSPDGRQLLMQIQDTNGLRRMPTLWIRPLDSIATRELPGTESDGGIPFWLPDSRYIVFSGSDGRLKKFDVTVGRPTTLCTSGITAVGGSMNSHGVILFGTPEHGVMRVSSSGGDCTAVTTPQGDFGPNIFPAFLPDDRHFIYVRVAGQMPPSVFAGSIDLKPDEQEKVTPLISGVGNPGPAGSLAMMYVPAAGSPAAWILFLRENAIWAQTFDDSRLQVSGEPVPIAEAASIFSASNAALTFLTGSVSSTALMWITPKGGATQTGGAETGFFRAIALSPNGERAAVAIPETFFRGSPDIWLVDLVAGRQEKFTSTGVAAVAPLWSSDGKYIVYSISGSMPTTQIYRRPADRSSDPELLLESPGSGYVTGLSSDGKLLLTTARDLKTNNADIRLISLESKMESPLIASAAVEVNGRFSPDGKWIAYYSDESSRNEVYVRSFTPAAAGERPHVGPPLLASKGGPPGALGGGAGPIWRGDSKALAYPSPSGWVIVEMTANAARPFGEPQALAANLNPQIVLDITPDFQRVLAAQPQGQTTANPATVILNWQHMLKK